MANWISRLLRGPYAEALERAVAQPAAPFRLPVHVVAGEDDVILRLLQADDGEAILAFARKLPDHDLLFLRRDVSRRDQVDEWLRGWLTGSP